MSAIATGVVALVCKLNVPPEPAREFCVKVVRPALKFTVPPVVVRAPVPRPAALPMVTVPPATAVPPV